MKWVKRGLWAAAWSAWVWCGFGLHRELPRPLAVHSALDVAMGEVSWGFINGTPLVVVHDEPPGATASAFRVIDVDTGRDVRVIRAPLRTDLHWTRCGARHGVAFTNAAPVDGGGPRRVGLQLVDLRSGAWRALSTRPAKHLCVHDAEPWVAYVEETDGADRLVVEDFERSGRLLDHRLSGGATIAAPPLFLPGSTRLLIQTTSPSGHRALQVWAVGAASVAEQVLPGVALGHFPAASRTGRIASNSAIEGASQVQVFDLERGRVIFVGPDKDELAAVAGGAYSPAPALGGGGDSVFGSTFCWLWDVDSGKAIWAPARHEEPQPFPSHEGFAVRERWDKWTGDVLPVELETFATRSLADGALQYRTWEKLDPEPYEVSADGRLAFCRHDGRVYRLPPPPDYPLLALCQSILAFPLVLTWLALRWWRKRRLVSRTA